MIQSSELRIGNWAVNYGQYVCIEADDIVDCHHQPESYEPIPITPEILEKAGFEKKRYNDHYSCYCKGDFVFPYTGKYFFHCTYKEARLFDYSNKGEILLHQLQNLYFALTGEELEINL